MQLNKTNIKLWSTIGSRATFGMVMLELVKKKQNIIVLTSDVSTSAGLDRFKNKYPENYIDVGIAEQNLIGVASGLASESFHVFTTTFAPFQTMRCLEQIKVNIGYMKNKVCMVGIASGVVLGTLGYTHCCVEDISIMRSIPNITVLSPADSGETAKCVAASLEHKQSVYIRLTGTTNNPIVYKDDYKFKIGKAIVLKKGNDIAIFATGSMVYLSLEVAKMLENKGLSVAVINIHTIKPIDVSVIKSYSKNKKLIVSIEEHSIIGGLGSSIAEINTRINKSAKHLILGLADNYDISGDYNYILKKNNLEQKKILKKILDEFKQQG